jgi:hypothetical protein
MGDVRGKVVFEGKPVTAGIITFAPKVPEGQFLAGRPSSASPDLNGEFTLTTERKGDGALVGVHNVTYQAPAPPRNGNPAGMENANKFGDLRLKPGYTVEIKPGTNNITLELERTP